VPPVSLVTGAVEVALRTLVFAGVAALWLYPPYWVYRDAARRGMDDAAKWAAYTLLAGFWVVFVYVGMRPLPPAEPDADAGGS
jgi:hypothetical protein